MNFGLYLGIVVKLIDLNTGEVIQYGAKPVSEFLKTFEGEYTLKII